MEFQEVLDFAAEDPVRGGHWEDLRLTDLMKVVKLHTTFMAHPSSVRCEEELIEAIATATGEKKDCLCFIGVIVHKDDTSKELLEWGSRVSSADSRPPNPQ